LDRKLLDTGAFFPGHFPNATAAASQSRSGDDTLERDPTTGALLPASVDQVPVPSEGNVLHPVDVPWQVIALCCAMMTLVGHAMP
jgi:hypothetical protein